MSERYTVQMENKSTARNHMVDILKGIGIINSHIDTFPLVKWRQIETLVSILGRSCRSCFYDNIRIRLFDIIL